MEKTLGAFEENELVALIMCAFSKAFDIISHEILLGKLKTLWHPRNYFKIFHVLLIRENAGGFCWGSKFGS